MIRNLKEREKLKLEQHLRHDIVLQNQTFISIITVNNRFLPPRGREQDQLPTLCFKTDPTPGVEPVEDPGISPNKKTPLIGTSSTDSGEILATK